MSLCVYRHIESGYVTVDSRSRSSQEYVGGCVCGVAVCCSMLQCVGVAVLSSVLQRVLVSHSSVEVEVDRDQNSELCRCGHVCVALHCVALCVALCVAMCVAPCVALCVALCWSVLLTRLLV